MIKCILKREKNRKEVLRTAYTFWSFLLLVKEIIENRKTSQRKIQIKKKTRNSIYRLPPLSHIKVIFFFSLSLVSREKMVYYHHRN